MVPIFKGKGDIMNCSCYRAVRLLEHGMKVVERVLDKRLNKIVIIIPDIQVQKYKHAFKKHIYS